MQRSLGLYLGDLQEASEQILQFTQGMNRAAYDANVLVQRAVERNFGIIGEAMNQMRKHHADVTKHFEESGQIVAFRNFLAHQYSAVDNREVWSAVESKVPALLAQIQALIPKLIDDKLP